MRQSRAAPRNFCYFHQTNRPARRRPRALAAPPEPEILTPFTLPLLEDRAAVQAALGQVVQRIAARQIDLKEAALLLYALQIAGSNLPGHPKPRPEIEPAPEPEPIHEIVADPELGPVAPIGDPLDPLRKLNSLSRSLYEGASNRADRAEATLAALYTAHPELKPPPPPVPVRKGQWQGDIFIPASCFADRKPPESATGPVPRSS